MNPFEKARKEGYSDKEIFEYLQSDEKYSSKIKKAKSEGYSDEDISSFLSKSPEKEKPQRPFYEQYIERPTQVLGQSAAAGLRSLPRSAFDLLKAGVQGAGGDISKLEEAQANAPQWLKDTASETFPSYEEMRQRQIQEGGAQAEGPFEKGIEKLGRFAGEAPYFGGIGGIRGAAGIVGAAAGAQAGEEMDLNPLGQAALTLTGSFLGHTAPTPFQKLSKQKLTPEVESYIKASKELGIDPLLTGMNPNQIQKVAQKWATHGIGGPEILQEAYKRRSLQVANAFEKAMDEAGENLFREPEQAGQALKEGITDATKQIEHTKSQLYRAVDKTLPKDATIKIADPVKLENHLKSSLEALEDSLALAPAESSVNLRLKKLKGNLESLLDVRDNEFPIKTLEDTSRSLHDVIKYERPGGADKLLIPFDRAIRKELDNYGKINPKYATARKAANEYFANDVVHIRQNLLQSIARSERPESTLAIMNTVSGIKNVERALNSLPNGKKMTEALKRYKLQSMLKDKLIDGSTGLMKVGGLKNFLNRKTDQYPVFRELAGPKGIRTLKLLEESGKGLEKGFNNLVNPSKTADTLIAIQSVVGPFERINEGVTKGLQGNLIGGASEAALGAAGILAPKWVAKIILKPKLAEQVFALSKAAQKSDWKAFNRILDILDDDLKKED